MFQEAGLDIPRLIETSSILFTTKMLQESDFIAVVPTEVARYYASYGMLAMLPIQLSCTMDAFEDHLAQGLAALTGSQSRPESAQDRGDERL